MTETPKENSGGKLTTGPIGKTLVRLTLPMWIGILAMGGFHLADTYFVGRLGTEPLAAITFTFPVVMVVAGLALGLGAGAAAVISRAVGAGDERRARRLTTDSLLLSVCIVAIVATTGYFTMDAVFARMGATAEQLPLVRQYMRIWYLGVVFVVVPMVGNNAIRARGDTKTPSIIMIAGVLVNVVMDPLLIFGWGPFPRMGLAGAALATVFARAATMVISLWVLYKRDRMVTLEWPGLAEIWDSWRQVLYIGLPSGATNVVIPVGVGLITRLVAQYGEAAVAGLGVAGRIEMMSMTLLFALNTVTGPFVGQNLGAGNLERVRGGVRAGQRFTLAWGLALAVLLALFGRELGGLFSDDPEVVRVVGWYLLLVPISFGLKGILMLAGTVLNVLHKPLHSMALIMLEMFGLYVPLAYLAGMVLDLGVAWVFAACAVARLLAGLAGWWWLGRQLRRAEAEAAAHILQPVAGAAVTEV